MKIIALSLVLLTLPAAAQESQCYPRAGMMAYLSAQYGESIIWRGITTGNDPNIVTELWISPDGTSWTLMRSLHGQDRACMIGSGSSWGTPSLPEVLGERL